MDQAKDVMTRDVVAIDKYATVEQAAHILVEHRMSGAPVVAVDGAVVGIISEYQLLELIYNPDLKSLPVDEFMTRNVYSVDVNDPLDQVADLFIRHRIRRVPVTDGDDLAGIITRGDLLRWRVADFAEQTSEVS